MFESYPARPSDHDPLGLAVGNASFRSLREWNFYYVDKTPHLWHLAQRPGYYFLSRPRRFGKTLLISTLQALFEGHEPLFRGLHIHDRWDWQTPTRGAAQRRNMPWAGRTGQGHSPPVARHRTPSPTDARDRIRPGLTRFRSLIDRVQLTTGQPVVVLVDEYDKPTLDVLETPELDLAS